jgi:hypothetical protein
MTRDELELVLRREGLTQPQTTAALTAADAYATTQAKAAIDALAFHAGIPGSLAPVHWYRGGTKVECGRKNQDLVNTTNPRQVTCDQCKTAFKAAS